MMSKKDMLTLGVLAIGGVAVASSFAGGDGDTGALEGKKGRAGGILGSQQGYGVPSPTIYNLPAAAPVTFPKAPIFDISKFLEPMVEPTVSRGAAGVSSAGKKEVVTPYLYTGGEVKAGAVSVAPWAMGVSTPAEIGVTTALKRASGPKKQPVSSGSSYRTGTRRTSVSGKYSGR
jgi:hypothetical protein